jgi:hypothetical protein
MGAIANLTIYEQLKNVGRDLRVIISYADEITNIEKAEKVVAEAKASIVETERATDHDRRLRPLQTNRRS